MGILNRSLFEINIEDHDFDSCLRLINSIPVENLAIRFNSTRRYDVGSLCYIERFSAPRKQTRPVTVESFAPDRREKIKSWIINVVSEQFISSSPMTSYADTSGFAKFANWCDLNGHQNFLLSAELYHYALQTYSLKLDRSIKDGEIKPFTANRDQAAPLHAAIIIFPNASINFRKDLLIISNISPEKSQTVPPSQNDLGSYLSTCDYVFEGLTDFLIQRKDFPSKIQLGTEQPWLMVGEYPFATKSILESTIKISKNIFWDYETGALRSFEECRKLSSQLKHHIERQRIEQAQLLKDSNTNHYHPKRMRLAKLAHDAFLALFVANTGMNDSPIADIPWDPNYSIEPSTSHGFKSIKFRANNKIVEFDVKSSFVKKFKKFIKLRSYICAETNQEYLFLGIKVHKTNKIIKLRPNEIFNFNQRLTHYYDANFLGFSFRELRSYKANYLLKTGESVSTTAQLLQNTEASIRKSYSSIDEETAIREITAMLHRLEQLLDDYNDEATPTGGCGAPGSPRIEVEAPDGYEPNCKKMEGCIFCQHFRLHANAEDIRKLLSMRFVVSQRIKNCENIEHFTKIHQPVIFQIDFFLDFLESSRPECSELIKNISKSIYERYELSNYWERQYTRLISLREVK